MYAVEIEIEKGEYTLVRKENPWTYDSEVLTFETKEEAEDFMKENNMESLEKQN